MKNSCPPICRAAVLSARVGHILKLGRKTMSCPPASGRKCVTKMCHNTTRCAYERVFAHNSTFVSQHIICIVINAAANKLTGRRDAFCAMNLIYRMFCSRACEKRRSIYSSEPSSGLFLININANGLSTKLKLISC